MNKKEIENELHRELNTMERDDLIDLIISYMDDKEKKSFVEEWKRGG